MSTLPVSSPVYPRVCGGTRSRSLASFSAAGLSPRVRGNREYLWEILQGGGSIPACAGEPHLPTIIDSSSGVYPRVCGGTAWNRHPRYSAVGLSPRVRGNQVKKAEIVSGRRSIPACAGEPGVHYSSGTGAPVYPRVCGGTAFKVSCLLFQRGLSPRVRGNPISRNICAFIPWSIPACAGEPNSKTCCLPIGRVYPRVCGGTADGNGRPAS